MYSKIYEIEDNRFLVIGTAALPIAEQPQAGVYEMRFKPGVWKDRYRYDGTSSTEWFPFILHGDEPPPLAEHRPDRLPSGPQAAVATGANTRGTTTLLKTVCQVPLPAAMGLPVPAEVAEVGRFDAIVFHRRHASFNAGVLEATLKSVVPPLTADGRTLMLVDEFEAITEPGSASSLLHGLVTLTVDQGALGAFVTHLAADLEPLPDAARIDGIFAEGLDSDLELVVDYQPQFYTVGRSTPEFIVSRLVTDARNPSDRVGFEALAETVGAEVAQRSLDEDWR